MSTNQASWIPGSRYTLAELASRYDIPREELESFQETVRIYPRGEAIIREGEIDKTLFLLRHGVVMVSKQIDRNEREQVAVIKAVNFFGEMSLLNDNPRSATVEAFSEEVLVYAVNRPNVHLILSNPLWGEMLISRLSKDLARTSNQLASTVMLMMELKQDKDALAQKAAALMAGQEQFYATVGRVFGVLCEFQKTIQQEAIVGSRGWAYLQALNRLTDELVQRYIPQVEPYAGRLDLDMLKTCLAEIEKKEPNPLYRNLFNTFK